MCPKDEIISAYVDGEVETPWTEKLKAHFSECAKCKARLKELQSMSQLLKHDKEPDFKPALNRVYKRIYFHSSEKSLGSGRQQEKELPFWKRRVHIPMPAAVMLSVVLFILFASFFFFMGQNNTQMANKGQELYNTQPIQVTVPIEGLEAKDLEVLLKLLNNKDFSQEVLMELPEDSQFTVFGEPEFGDCAIDK
ncbi:MAG: zf-HC2 domain-containing protein [Spirochaetales bacterium]|nr:zf-HC2 domain-containing protein [Spirochaetales bacterium]